MKILVFSDSHMSCNNMKCAINYFQDEIDTVVHLGDNIIDTNDIKLPNIYKVAGNNDYGKHKTERTIEINGYTIFITHGHKYDVHYTLDELAFRADELGASLVLFGHTHKKQVAYEKGVLILNPGSISYPRDDNVGSFAVIYLDEKINFDFYYVNSNEITKIIYNNWNDGKNSY